MHHMKLKQEDFSCILSSNKAREENIGKQKKNAECIDYFKLKILSQPLDPNNKERGHESSKSSLMSISQYSWNANGYQS